MKRLTCAAIAFLGVIQFGATRLVAQDRPAPAVSSDSASADQQIALMRKDIRSMKRQIIAANLGLTDTEATKFWPVYEQYSADVEKINDTRIALIREYSEGYLTLTDEQADSLYSSLARHRHCGVQPSSEICPYLPQGVTRKDGCDLFPTGPPHQHDDRPESNFADSPGPKPR